MPPSEIPGGPGGEDREAQIVGPGGVGIAVPRSPLAPSNSGLQTMQLVKPSPGVAILRPASYVQVMSLVSLAIAAVAWWQFPGALRTAQWGAAGVSGLVGCVLTLCGVVGLVGSMRGRRVIVDRGLQTVTIKPATPMLGQTTQIPFAQIAALQLCSRHVSRGEGLPSYGTFELNLVLINPPGQRINLTSQADEHQVRNDAKAIAEIMSKELLDHA